jgi:hypothetical protein
MAFTAGGRNAWSGESLRTQLPLRSRNTSAMVTA